MKDRDREATTSHPRVADGAWVQGKAQQALLMEHGHKRLAAGSWSSLLMRLWVWEFEGLRLPGVMGAHV